MTNQKPRQRNIVIPLLAALAVCMMVIGAFGFAAYRAGSIEVSVREYGPGGTNIDLNVPAAFAETALRLVPAQVFDEVMLEAGEFMPLMRAARDELADLPDCVLIEVISHDENVLIAKRKGRMVIEVQSDDEAVRVAVPMGILSSALSKMADAAEKHERSRWGS